MYREIFLFTYVMILNDPGYRAFVLRVYVDDLTQYDLKDY